MAKIFLKKRSNHKKLMLNPAIWIFYFILLGLPDFWILKTPTTFSIFANFALSATIYGVVTWTLCFIAAMAKKYEGQWLSVTLHVIFHVVIVSWSVSQFFLIFLFNRQWDEVTMELVMSTSLTETGGFISTFLLLPKSVALICATLFLLLTEQFLLHKVPQIPVFFAKKKLLIVQCLIIAYVYSHAIFFGTNVYANSNRAARFAINRTTPFNLWQSFLFVREVYPETQKCKETLKHYNEHSSTSLNVANVVVILGESFSRNHSSLYGYSLETNPRLNELSPENLVLFSNVIAPYNYTHECVRYIFSMASTNETTKWCDAPLFPAILKNAGWNVVFFSNQSDCSELSNRMDLATHIFDIAEINKRLFNNRNKVAYAEDGPLLDDYERNRKQLEKPDKNLIIFHLWGQHYDFKQRYPASEAYFKISNIKDNWRTDAERLTVTEYDNANRYNDKIVMRIIDMFKDKNAAIFYFSDHGEEVYEYRHHLGRVNLAGQPAQTVFAQIEIPFMVYLSPKFIQANPDAAAQLYAAKAKPFMTDDFPHLLLDFMQSDSQWINKKKSPLQASYDTTASRIIYKSHINYDSLKKSNITK